MKEPICPECKKKVSNEFGVQLEYCTNCGFQLSKFTESKTVVLPASEQTKVPVQKNSNTKYLLGCLGTGFGLILLSAIGLLGYYWYSASSEAGINNPDYFGTIIVPKSQTLKFVGGDSAEIESLDPQALGIGMIIPALFDGLAEYNNKNAKLTPSLATRWESNSDATVWTFYLRKDAKWSNGAPITAEDFVYSWRRLLTPDDGARSSWLLYWIKNGRAYNESKAKAEDVGVKAIDKNTLEVTMERPAPFFDKLLAQNALRPVFREAIEKHGDKWFEPENIVTSGAFKLVEWSKKSQIVLERNPEYWDNSNNKLDKIIFPQDPRTDKENDPPYLPATLYKEGAIDATRSYLSAAEGYKTKKDFLVSKAAGSSYLFLNTKFPPLDDVRVRKAMSLAIDRQKLKKDGLVQFPSYSYVAEIEGYINSDVIGYRPAEARKLLDEAGFPGGKGFPEIEYVYNTSASNRDIAQAVQKQWEKELGIRVKLVNMDFGDFLKARGALNYKGVALGGWLVDFNDPFDFLNEIVSDDNDAGWNDPKFNELVGRSNSEKDQGKRFSMLSQAESLMLEQHPLIPLSNSDYQILVKPYVKNLALNPMAQINWREVFIDTSLTESSLSNN